MIRLCLLAVVGVVLSTASVRAQASSDEITISSFNPEDAVAPGSVVEGPGIKVGEGTVLHPVVGLETGVVSNVFYEETDPRATGVLRLLAQISTASLSPARLAAIATPDADNPQENHGNFQYRADARVSYDLMLSGSETVRDTGGLGLGLSLHALANAQGRLSFGVDEDFQRLIRAANFETDANTNRDLNNLRLMALYHPRDRTISGYLYYGNKLDVFERSEQQFANRMGHTIGLHPMWRVLPQTMLYLELSWSYIAALDASSMKPSSYPLVLRAGLATLLSINTTLNFDAGYTNGFYSRGPSFSSPTVGAQIGYRYSPLGRVSLGYGLVYEDSINANYFRDHVLRATIQQLYVPFVLMVQPEVHFRRYDGVTVVVPDIMGPDTRNDVIFSVIGGMHYNFRNWMAATLNYRFSTVQTDYMYTSGGIADDPSYVRHELLAGMRVAM